MAAGGGDHWRPLKKSKAKLLAIDHMTNILITGKQKGASTILVLLVGLMASVVLGAVVLMAGTAFDNASRQMAFDQALMVAEAGAHYYRWHLAHSPSDYQDGTGQPGPYVHDYKDPEGYVVGKYSLEIIPPEPGYTQVSIISTGWMLEYPSIKRTVRVRYGIPSLARYSFLNDANMWFGSGLTVHGRVMSNGGIRQDGINDSTVQSLQETYLCGIETGCGTPTTKPGVWGNGGPAELWEFPVPPVDFVGINLDLEKMQEAAEDSNSHYAPTTSPGYHVVFQSDGTARIYRVTSTNYYRGYDNGVCSNLYQRINGETFLATHNLETAKVLFFEDTVWVEGVVKGNVTVVAARYPFDSNNEDMWIRNNVTYLAKDDNNHLALIAQRNIYFAKDLPNTFEIDAALLAKSGKIIRHNYAVWGCGVYSNAVRNRLIIYGSVISKMKSYWNYGTSPSSGFVTRDVAYDSSLYLEPPPYFPAAGDYEVISWDEEE